MFFFKNASVTCVNRNFVNLICIGIAFQVYICERLYARREYYFAIALERAFKVKNWVKITLK